MVDIEDLTVRTRTTCEARCFRSAHVEPLKKKILGFEPPRIPTEDEIVQEARRCIFCYDAPCGKCCPDEVDVREYVHAASVRNWYYAAKVILSSNPMPLSTAALCRVKEYCQGGCNLRNTIEGPIKTNIIQQFSVRRFREFNIMPVNPPSNGKKVAVVGAGPASLSCAAFLRRLGFEVTVYEKRDKAGGILTSEILENRLPKADVEFEIKLIEASGVKFEFNKELGKDFTLEGLQKDFDAVFVGIGKPNDIKPSFPCEGALTSKEFLTQYYEGKTSDFTGKKVLVIGGGDTAIDCASAASRTGATVTMAFRKDFQGLRAPPSEVKDLLDMEVELLPLMNPTKIANGEVTFSVELHEGKDYKPSGDVITRKFDAVILAFGSTGEKIQPHDNLFIGGDCAGSSTVIEAVNDGKVAAKQIAKLLGKDVPLPLFETEVEKVSLATEIDGMKFENPFGISSAPVSGTYECIANCFRMGFGFAVTKTILLSKDVMRENDFRIVKCDEAPFASGSFMNICTMTEHTEDYWYDAIRRLKKEFPTKVLIASISCQDNKEDWQRLTKNVIEAGADGIELNLSCPNEVHGDGGFEGGFDSANKIGMALGQSPVSIKRICSYIKEVTTVPFYCKLTPNITDPVDIAKAAIEGKADGVSMINTVSGIPKFYNDGTPLPQLGKEKVVFSGGLSGDQVRPIALRQISKVKNAIKDIHILGIGGISSAETALQHLYAGANVFQVCSAAQRFSYDIVREMKAGLQFFLYSWSRPDLRSLLGHTEQMAYLPHEVEVVHDSKQDRPVPTIFELSGTGGKRMVQREDFDHSWTLHAQIDRKHCIDCGKCALSCRDNSVEAIVRDKDGHWVVDESKCIGCGLCASVCPFYAMKLKNVAPKKWHHKEE